jgi:hypothetical protein
MYGSDTQGQGFDAGTRDGTRIGSTSQEQRLSQEMHR